MPKNIRIEEIDVEDIARISLSDAERLKKYQLAEGDIVYSRRGDVEKCALVTKNEANWLCGTGCLRIRIPKNKSITPYFLHAFYLHQLLENGFLVMQLVRQCLILIHLY
jgi:type I restriction enzyme S subunit